MMMPAIAQMSPARIITTQKLRWMPGTSATAVSAKWTFRLLKSPDPNQPSVYAPRAKNAT